LKLAFVLEFLFLLLQGKRKIKNFSMFFFLSKKEPKSQEKVIGLPARPDAAPLPFPAYAPFLVLVNRQENAIGCLSIY